MVMAALGVVPLYFRGLARLSRTRGDVQVQVPNIAAYVCMPRYTYTRHIMLNVPMCAPARVFVTREPKKVCVCVCVCVFAYKPA